AHLKSRGLVVAPPAGEAGQPGLRMTFVHERATDRAGPAVEVFVAAPDREVGAAVVQSQRQVADGMGEVEAYGAAMPVRECGDCLEVERLPGAVLHAGQHHQRDTRAVFGQRTLD